MKTPLVKFVAFSVTVLLSSTFARAQQAPIGIAQEMLKDPMTKELAMDSNITATKLVTMLTAIRVDLNADGSPEFIINGIGCGSANCPYWIYRKVGNRYIEVPGRVQGIYIRALPRRTNGWRDLEFANHSSATHEPRIFYRYNGSKYVER